MAPGTGVVLQNRAACFAYGPAAASGVAPGRRPYHTIIPGMLLRDEWLWGPFGVVGGFVQAQAHVQLVSALVDDGLDPQAALDRPRFRVDGDAVLLEEGHWGRAPRRSPRSGSTPVRSRETRADFGCGQLVLAEPDRLLGGADARGDGSALGYSSATNAVDKELGRPADWVRSRSGTGECRTLGSQSTQGSTRARGPRLLRRAYDCAASGSVAPTIVRDVVARSWERSEQAGVDPLERAPVMLERAEARRRSSTTGWRRCSK